MKKLLIAVLAVIITLNLNAQEEGDTTRVGIGKNVVTVVENDEGTNVNLREDLVVVDEKDDTVKVKLGRKAIAVFEEGNETHVIVIEEEEFSKHGWRKRPDRFRGHWAGFELGLNNLATRGGQLAGSETEHRFLDLNTAKSWEFDLNFMQFSIPFGKPAGLVTGMGFKWNNYWFDRNNTITKHNETGVIVGYIPLGDITYTKSKLNTFYLTLPLLFEFQFGPQKKGFFGVGVIGDLKLSSKTKLKYYDGGSKQKEKHKDDFNLSPLRYHLTARAGFRCIKVFANVSMVPFFEKDMGPELYPFTIGLTIINFR